MAGSIYKYLNTYKESSTLAFFRMAFGIMMFFGLVRFALNGWIEEFYLLPVFHFSYFGFEWVKPIGNYTYLLFVLCGISSLTVAAGYKYRISIILFFLSFTYIELMDKTTYLNHYYFVSVISFAMVFLPANAGYSIDALKNPKLAFSQIPAWTIDSLKLLLGIVYFYAGLAKLNSDWLIEAMPLQIWLPNNFNLPLIGSFLNQVWAQYAFSWIGMVYDLAIVFLLLYKPTRLFAFALVVIFHVLTRILFPIGIFPYIMIISTLIFFDSRFHERFLDFVFRFFGVATDVFKNGKFKTLFYSFSSKVTLYFYAVFISFQLLFPFRYLLYPDELFWTEEGYRFSWRVMLMEKAGYTEFIVTDPDTKEKIYVNNRDFLTTFQEKQMSFQPDFILEYAHFLRDYYQKRGILNPEVRVKSYVALNGRLSKLYIDPQTDLAKQQDTFRHKTWILPFNDEIKGF